MEIEKYVSSMNASLNALDFVHEERWTHCRNLRFCYFKEGKRRTMQLSLILSAIAFLFSCTFALFIPFFVIRKNQLSCLFIFRVLPENDSWFFFVFGHFDQKMKTGMNSALKYGSEEKGSWFYKCSILLGFIMSKNQERLRSELLSEDKITNLLGFLT